MVPQRGLLGAARLAPSGPPFGRSNWLRQFVEPAFCLSGVRTEITQRLGPMRVSLDPCELVRKEDSNKRTKRL
jgi:hypothetical protein